MINLEEFWIFLIIIVVGYILAFVYLLIINRFLKWYKPEYKKSETIKLMNPQNLFFSHGPTVKLVDKALYEDRSEINLQSYLEVLPSIALYGFKYAIPIKESGYLLNGNFRAYSALELGIDVPVYYSKEKESHFYIIRFVKRRIRKLLRNNSLFRKKYMLTNRIIPLKVSFQRMIL